MNRIWLPAIVVAALVFAAVGGTAIALADEPTRPADDHSSLAAPGQTAQLEAQAPRGRWNPATGTGEIILDDQSYYAVFQGEGDVETWRDTADAEVTGAVLEGETGDSEGDILQLDESISVNQEPGRYAGEDLTARVREPEIDDLDLYNSIGTELDDVSELRRDEPLLVAVEWNYVEAEDLQVALLDRDGDVSIEREILSANPTSDQADLLPADFDDENLTREVQGLGTTGLRTAYWLFDVDELEDGSYTLRVEGVDDLNSGEAVETLNFSVGRTGTETATPTETQTVTATATASPTETTSPTTAPQTATPTDQTHTTQPATESPSPTPTPTTPSPTAGADGPGFGPLLALVALALAVGYAVRTKRE